MSDLVAKDIMTTGVVTVKSDITIGELSKILLENKVSGVPVVDKEDKLSAYKVALTKAFAIVMENGLWLIGISPLKKM